MIWLLSPAFGWQSECFTGEADPDYAGEPQICEDGYHKARERWVVHSTDDLNPMAKYGEIRFPEHALIFEEASASSGVPSEALQDFTVSTLVSADMLPGELLRSIDPLLTSGTEGYERTLRASEMTQLPDMSFTLWDWARGNQICPLSSSLDVQACHGFTAYMGGLNSSHFAPQSEAFYVWYHDLALEQSQYCAEMESKGAMEDHAAYVQACDRFALVLEGVAQHYLQDAWSSGHMWERWGSPELSDWDIAGYSAPQQLGRAMMVSLLAGSLHGTKGVLDTPDEPLPGIWDDPMCAPAPLGSQVEYVDGLDGTLHEGIGDIFFGEASFTYPELYAAQRTALLSCGALGMREVYEEGGQSFGPLGALSEELDPRRVPTSSQACFGQRVTNASLAVGAAVHGGGAWPMQVQIPVPLSVMLTGLAKIKYSSNEHVDTDPWTTPALVEGTALTLLLQLLAKADPTGTTGSTMQHTTMLGMKHNGAFLKELHREPASWVDPAMPWGLEEEDERALSLTFATETAWQRCEQDVLGQLSALRQGSPEEQAQCLRLAAPFIADDGEQALCDLAGSPWTQTHDGGAVAWCSVEADDEDDGILDEGGFEEDGLEWSLSGNAEIRGELHGFGPASGKRMAVLSFDEDAGAAYSGISQQVTGSGDYTLSFQYRLITSHKWHDCSLDWGDPWTTARVEDDSGVALLYWIEQASWCGTLTELDSGLYASDWVPVEQQLTLDGAGGSVNFLVGSGSGWWEHNVLIDSVKLKPME